MRITIELADGVEMYQDNPANGREVYGEMSEDGKHYHVRTYQNDVCVTEDIFPTHRVGKISIVSPEGI